MMDTEIPQYCRRCGTMLLDGVCPTCPEQVPVPVTAVAPHPHKPVIHAVTAAPHETPAPHRWFSSIPTPPVAARGKGFRYVHMWNWGAFLLCPLWLMNHGRIGRAIVFLVLCLVPFFWPFAFGMTIAYGIKGNRVASTSRDFVDDAQFVQVQNAWRDAGFGFALAAVMLSLVVGYANVTSLPRR